MAPVIVLGAIGLGVYMFLTSGKHHEGTPKVMGSTTTTKPGQVWTFAALTPPGMSSQDLQAFLKLLTNDGEAGILKSTTPGGVAADGGAAYVITVEYFKPWKIPMTAGNVATPSGPVAIQYAQQAPAVSG